MSPVNALFCVAVPLVIIACLLFRFRFHQVRRPLLSHLNPPPQGQRHPDELFPLQRWHSLDLLCLLHTAVRNGICSGAETTAKKLPVIDLCCDWMSLGSFPHSLHGDESTSHPSSRE